MKLMLVAMMLVASLGVFAQAKKPTLMVMPSDAWCNEHGYMQTYGNQGSIEKVPDYKAAVSTDKQLNAVISKINNLMADRGFPLKDLQQTLKAVNTDAAEDALITSKGGKLCCRKPIRSFAPSCETRHYYGVGLDSEQNGTKEFGYL